MEPVFIPQQRYKVMVRCYTFNHSQYIEDALNGFLMQRTDFPFVCVIVDDCSTDGEQRVLRSFIANDCNSNTIVENENERTILIYAQHKTNNNCHFAIYFLKQNLHGKIEKKEMVDIWREHSEYEALCEGDDYWIDCQKLQKQVAFLDNHEDYGMCHTDFDLTVGRRNHKSFDIKDGNYWPSILTESIQIGTLTSMIRLSVLRTLPRLNRGRGWHMGDRPLWIELAHEAKIHYIPEVTANYRKLKNSSSHSDDIHKMIAFRKNAMDITLFYAEYFNVNINKNKISKRYYENVIRDACHLNEKTIATHFYKMAKREKALSFKSRIFYILSSFPILNFIKTDYK